MPPAWPGSAGAPRAGGPGETVTVGAGKAQTGLPFSCKNISSAGCPAPQAACSTYFQGVAAAQCRGRLPARAGPMGALCYPSLRLSRSRQTIPVKRRVWLLSPSSDSQANSPALVSIPLPAHSSLGESAHPSDTALTTGSEKSGQRKCPGGQEGFWELLCPAEEAAGGGGWDEQCWAPEGGPTSLFGTNVRLQHFCGGSNSHPTLATACPGG